MSGGVSIGDITADWKRRPVFTPYEDAAPASPFPTIHQVAMSEPDERFIKEISPHVFEAHEASKLGNIREAVVQVSVNTITGALELIPQNPSVLAALKKLGGQIKVRINW